MQGKARQTRNHPWEMRYWHPIRKGTRGDVRLNSQVEEALEILKSGNQRDAERALETLQGVVYGFGMKVCGTHEDAQDTAQETLIRLARQLREFPDARALSVWLYKVAKTQCLMSRRKSKFAPTQMLALDALMPGEADSLLAEVDSGKNTPEKIALNAELRTRLEEAILALPKPYRLVLILRDVEQLEMQEVAEVMGISEKATKMRLHRARATVRAALAGYSRQPQKRKKKVPA
jgi:RNA polymerase sigma-70 factor, ECF subfamily